MAHARSEPIIEMNDALPLVAEKQRHHNKYLLLIAAYKGLQALLFIALGFGAMHLLHKDIPDIFEQVRDALHFNPESRLVNFLLDRAALLNDPVLRRIGLVAFSYAGVSFAEGLGLFLEKAWGEYLTLAITVSFLPWEVFEILRRLTWVRVGLLIINLLVLLYLLKVVFSRRFTKSGRF
jgi:uncharacterized membrane protein (DUF2068 family)